MATASKATAPEVPEEPARPARAESGADPGPLVSGSVPPVDASVVIGDPGGSIVSSDVDPLPVPEAPEAGDPIVSSELGDQSK